MLKPLFDQFLLEKEYVQGCSKHTTSMYSNALKAYSRIAGTDQLPTQSSINLFIVGMRKEGLSVVPVICKGHIASSHPNWGRYSEQGVMRHNSGQPVGNTASKTN